MTLTFDDIKSLVLEATSRTLACLGASYPKCGDLNGDNIRALAHRVKDGNPKAIEKAASLLYKYVSPHSVLIPIPSHTGVSTYTKELANIIAQKSNSIVLDVLRCGPRDMLYNRKMKGANVNNINLGIYCVGDVNGLIAKQLHKAKNIILIDNVVDSGITYNQAHNALAKEYKVDAWMLALGVVEKSDHDVNDERVFRSIITL